MATFLKLTQTGSLKLIAGTNEYSEIEYPNIIKCNVILFDHRWYANET